MCFPLPGTNSSDIIIRICHFYKNYLPDPRMNPTDHRGSLLHILHVCSDAAQGPSPFSLLSSLSFNLSP